MTQSARHITLASLLVVANLVPARRLTCQETQGAPNTGQLTAVADSLPFRAGQWGAEFAINDGTVGLGVLRFRSQRKAWLVDAGIGASWSETESPFVGEQSGRSVFVRLRAGPRRYHPLAAGSAAYGGMGLSGAYAWAAYGDVRARSWEASAFGEIGAVYFVTRRLSLGAQIELTATFSSTRETSPSSPFVRRDRRVSIGTRPVRIVGALYF